MFIPGNLLTTAMAVMPHTDVDQAARKIPARVRVHFYLPSENKGVAENPLPLLFDTVICLLDHCPPASADRAAVTV